MKRLASVLLVIISVVSILQFVDITSLAASEIIIDSNHFPDTNLMNCVKVFDDDGNGSLSDTEISEADIFICSNKNISSFAGINYLKDLKYIDCSSNNLTSLDLNLPNLKTLICNGNKLTSLDVSKLSELQTLKCQNNKLTELDVSSIQNLGSLTCYSNKLTNIKFCTNYNRPLSALRIYDNNIKTLDISALSTVKNLYLKGVTEYTDPNTSYKYLRYYSSSSSEISYDINTTVLTARISTSCSPSNGGTCTQSFSAEKGSAVKISAEPKSGYEFVKWQEEDNFSDITDVSTSKTYSFVADGTNRNYIAVFKAIPTSAPTTKPAPTPDSLYNYLPGDIVSREDVGGFVSGLYKCTFDRLPDTEGSRYWYDLLKSQTITGGQAAKDFIKSPEFASMNYSDEEFVRVLYSIFFSREPDDSGMNYWLEKLSSKEISRADCVDFFVDSQEWADMCATYGIRSGTSIMPKVNVSPSSIVADFTENLYKTALNRDPDYPGMAYWALLLSSHRITGEEVGLEFFLSKEFKDQNISNKEFVNRLYLTFMGREGESGGMNYWIGLLEGGTSRETVILGFTRSEEYLDRCIDASILPYRY
ncbi:MAG: DUF4214 domain-containing protein [Clostridiales bacterium]|nr:DUF4214 domain-containing protein [Clostridiales bacterium]